MSKMFLRLAPNVPLVASIAQPAAPRRVLIVKPSSLGDVVTAMPILRGLRRTFGRDVHVAWLLVKSCAPLVAHDADLNEVILFDRKALGLAWRSGAGLSALRELGRSLHRERFDWVIDAQGLLRSGLVTRGTGSAVRAGFGDAREGAWLFYNRRVTPKALHTVDRNIELARSLGIDARGEDMALTISPAGASFAEEFCGRHGLRRGGYLVAVPPTRWPTKLYPARHWQAVIAELSRDLPVVLIGSPSEGPIVQAACDGLSGPAVINAAGQTDVAQMVGLIAASAGVICSDSAAKFIAPAVGVECVCIIGPTRVEHSGPYLRGKAVVSPVACQGCLRRQCPHTTCMAAISPQQVIAAAREMLGIAECRLRTTD